MLEQECLISNWQTRGNMATMQEVNRVLDGYIRVLALHLDFDINEVRYWKQTIVFLLSSKQSIGLADLIYQTTVPLLKRDLGPWRVSDKSSFLNLSPLQNGSCSLICDQETL